MSEKILRFNLKNIHALEVFERFMPQNRLVLNRTEWRGKEPRSCAVTNIHSGTNVSGVDVVVTYRPKNFVSYLGQTRYEGWSVMAPLRDKAGALVDVSGVPLKDGEPPVYRAMEVYADVDFNELDFGDFNGESDAGPARVPRMTYDRVLDQIRESGEIRAGISSSFIAPRRHRPNTKIILAKAPTGTTTTDGFGTRIVVVNIDEPQFERVLMERLMTLMTDFMEGRASMKSIEGGGMVFVELSDSLVDCTPNEHDLDSHFDVLQTYVPLTFLEDLARRLEALYAVEVSVVEGKNAGLVLRRTG